MRVWRSLLFCMGVLVLSSPAWGQSNAKLDTILAAKEASFGDVAYLVMTAVKKVPDDATFEEAAATLAKQPWSIRTEAPGKPVTLGVYSYMLMRAFGLHGGVMYSILPGPRYAARELLFLGFIHGDGSPYRTITGIEAVNMIGEVLSYTEGLR